MNMGNVHRMFITYIYIEQESRNTINTYDFLVQVRSFLLPLSLKVLRHKERDTHSFYSGFSICPPSRAAPVARKFVWPLRAPKVEPSRSVSSSQLTDFFSYPPKSSALASGAWRHSHPPIWDFYFDISEWHILSARALIPAIKFAPN